MVNVAFTRGAVLLAATATAGIATAYSVRWPARITDPMPGPVERSGLGVSLVPFVRIDSDGAPARLNMFKALPDGRMFINDQRGDLYVVADQREVRRYLHVQDHVDLFYPAKDNRQVGFLSFAFHPDFERNGIFYTVTTAARSRRANFPSKRPVLDKNGAPVEPDHDDVVHKWTADDPAASTFSGSVVEIMRIEQPYRDHNTGELAFNPLAHPGDDDYGLLYIGVADGGSDGFPVSQTDPLDNGQDLSTPLGAILRIDPEAPPAAGRAYGIPASNPFAVDGDPSTLGEIYAFGLRNPHRFSWDPKSGHLLAFEIGQWLIEEIDVIVPGGNYGWGDREGPWVINERDEHALYPSPPDDADRGLRAPWAMYDHPGDARVPLSGPGAIAGGYVYVGRDVPYLAQRVVFADFSADGRFFVLDAVAVDASPAPKGATVLTLDVYDAAGRLSSPSRIIHGVDGRRTDVRIGQDHQGELYVTNKHNGWVYRVRPVVQQVAWAPSALLRPSGALLGRR